MTVSNYRLLPAVVAGLATLTIPAVMAADSYPQANKTLTIVVPWDAGGGVDIIMRMVQPSLERELGITVQVVNQPGGGSQAGLTKCMVAAPDGYTLCASGLPSTNLTYLISERGAPYTRESFQPVGTIAYELGSVIVAKDSPYQTIGDLVADAKARPGSVRIGNAGRYTNAHIDMLAFTRATEIQVAPVFFTGGAPAVTALMGGHVEAVTSTPSNYMGQFASGDIRVLGIMSEEASALLPGVPTLRDAGYVVDGFTTRTLAFQADVAPEIVATVEAALERASHAPEFKDKLANLGSDYFYLNAADTDALWDKVDTDLLALLALEAQ